MATIQKELIIELDSTINFYVAWRGKPQKKMNIEQGALNDDFETKKILNPKSLMGIRYSKDLLQLCEN